MSLKERDLLKAVHEAETGYITAKAASDARGIAYRQFKRILRRFRSEGDKGLAHRLRGKPPNRRMSEAARKAEVVREFIPEACKLSFGNKLPKHRKSH